MLVLTALGGIGWALIANPWGARFGVASVVSGFVGGLVGKRIETVLSERAAPRKLTGSQRQRLLDALSRHPVGSLEVCACAADQEAVDFSEQLAEVLRAAGGIPILARSVGHKTPHSMAVGAIDIEPGSVARAQQLIDAFVAAGIDTSAAVVPIGGTLDRAVAVLIGAKPNGNR